MPEDNNSVDLPEVDESDTVVIITPLQTGLIVGAASTAAIVVAYKYLRKRVKFVRSETVITGEVVESTTQA
jgi:hypothetical protein